MSCKCKFCEFASASPSGLEYHETKHTGIPLAVVCLHPGCNYSTNTQSAIEDHIKSGHATKGFFKCSRCKVLFLNADGLKSHACTNPKPAAPVHRCPHCAYTSWHKGALAKHVQAHGNSRLFVCNEPGCTYKANYVSNLNAHRRTHTGEKNFACSSCCTRFAHTTTAKQHIKSGGPDDLCIGAKVVRVTALPPLELEEAVDSVA